MDQLPNHVPAFRPQHWLSAWPDCTIEARCVCGNSSMPSVRLLIEQYGDQRFEALVPRLRCEGCGAQPAQVWLVAGLHRSCVGGPPPDWAVEIRPGR